MSANFIWIAFVLSALTVLAVPVAWIRVHRSKRHLELPTPELRLKSESELRRDVTQAIFGVGAILAVVASAGTFFQNQQKNDEEHREKLMTALGGESIPAQTDAIHQLMTFWKSHDADAVDDHIDVLTSFIKARAPIPYKHELPPSDWKYDEEINSVERTRPSLQAAMVALSELNQRRVFKGKENRVQLRDVDLRFLKLPKSELQNVDLSSSLLVDTDFTGSNLSNCRAYSAWIMGANFRGATLKGADFRDTRVDPSVDFSGASVDSMTDFTKSRAYKASVVVTELTVNPDVKGTPTASEAWKFKFDPNKK
jgi:hypothetical protein